MKISSLILLSLIAPAVLSSQIDYTSGNTNFNNHSVEGGSANSAWNTNGSNMNNNGSNMNSMTHNQVSDDTMIMNIGQRQQQGQNTWGNNTNIQHIQQASTQYQEAPAPIIEVKESKTKQSIKNVVEHVNYAAPARQANNTVTMIQAAPVQRRQAPRVIVMPAAAAIQQPQQRIVLEAPQAAQIVNKTIILRAAEAPKQQDKHIIVFNHGSSNQFNSGSNSFGSSWGLNNAVAGQGGSGGIGGISSGQGAAGFGGNGGAGGQVISNGIAGSGGAGGQGGNATMYGQSGHGGAGGAGGQAQRGGQAGNGGAGGAGGSVKGTKGGDKPSEAQIRAAAQQKANNQALMNRINGMVNNMSNKNNLNVGSARYN